MVIEVLAVLLAAAFALVTLGVADVAFLAIVGVVRISRCAHCHRLRLTTGEGPLEACLQCRHERLLHPIHAAHHSAQAPEASD
jgi:molybdenum cofactor biosynthesis enzyme MoaA